MNFTQPPTFYTCLALWKHHKAKQVYCIHHANIQETYYLPFML